MVRNGLGGGECHALLQCGVASPCLRTVKNRVVSITRQNCKHLPLQGEVAIYIKSASRVETDLYRRQLIDVLVFQRQKAPFDPSHVTFRVVAHGSRSELIYCDFQKQDSGGPKFTIATKAQLNR